MRMLLAALGAAAGIAAPGRSGPPTIDAAPRHGRPPERALPAAAERHGADQDVQGGPNPAEHHLALDHHPAVEDVVDEVQEREARPRIDLGDEIDVARGPGLGAGHRAEQAQAGDAAGADLRLVLAEDAEHALALGGGRRGGGASSVCHGQ